MGSENKNNDSSDEELDKIDDENNEPREKPCDTTKNLGDYLPSF